MGYRSTIAAVLIWLLCPFAVWALEVGDRAPPFEADSTMGTIRLADYAGRKNVLLAFYYKDFTGG